MINLWLHPSERRLNDFVDGELPEVHARRVAAHVRTCGHCARKLWVVRQIDAAAQAVVPPSLPPGLWHRLERQHKEGSAVILPAGGRSATAPRRRHGTGMAAAMVVLLSGAAAALLLDSPRLAADASELHFSPAQPQAGDLVQVEYRATSLMSGHPSVRLRARLRTADHPQRWWKAHTLSELVPVPGAEGRLFRGSFRLPEDVVYAVFAVETADAADIDQRGHQWALLAHEMTPDGQRRPTAAALLQQYYDLRHERMTTLSHAAADDMFATHPDDVRSHHVRYTEEIAAAAADARPAVRERHRSIAARLGAALPLDASYDGLSAALAYAQAAGDTLTARTLTARLLSAHPHSARALGRRLGALSPLWRTDRAAYWDSLEALWLDSANTGNDDFELSGRAGIVWNATNQARISGDVEAFRRWGLRVFDTMPFERVDLAVSFLAVPELRGEGIRLLRDFLNRTEEVDLDNRQLATTAGLAAIYHNRNRAQAAVALGGALAADGELAAGQQMLKFAVDLHWDPDLFRRVAAAYLTTGDTARALQLHARVAVDPATPSSYADSLRYTGLPAADAAWAVKIAEARRLMDAVTLAEPWTRNLPGGIRLTDMNGRTTSLRAEHDAETVVAFWNPHCPYSVAHFPELKQLIRGLQADGVRVVAVARWIDGPNEPGFAHAIATHGLDFPIYFDRHGDAERAFERPGTPFYFVLDRSGTIRFRNVSNLAPVLRQVDLLRRQRLANGQAGRQEPNHRFPASATPATRDR